jgi:hypothetical protein
MVVNQTPANAEDRTELFYAVFLAQGGDKFQGLLASDISKAVAFFNISLSLKPLNPFFKLTNLLRSRRGDA